MIGLSEISIIIPVYNVEKYLDRCLNTVTKQSFTDLEIILVDDGSKDRSGSMCDEWSKRDSRIKVVHQINSGAGAARNRGLREATGKYIGFVDSDDWIDLNMYRKLYSMLTSHPDAKMSMCGTVRTSKGIAHESKENINVEILDTEDMLRRFFRENGGESDFGICTKLIDRRILTVFSFVEGTVSEDVIASYYFISHSSKIIYTPEKLYCYFDNNDSGVTKHAASKRDFEYIEAFKRIKSEVDNRFPELSDLAWKNYIRSNFTILSKMKLYGFDKRDKELVDKYRTMRKIVRKNFILLMKLKMPLSRKVLLFVDCI